MALNFEGLEIPDEAKEALSNQVSDLQKNVVAGTGFQ